MQVNSISNTNNAPNFNGKVIIVGELSAVPTRLVRKSAETLKGLMEDKPYDLFIKQNHKQDTVSLIVQKEKDFDRNKGLKAVVDIHKNVDLYDVGTIYALEEYEMKQKALPPTFGERCKKFFDKLGEKFLDVVQDKDEI